MQSLSSTQTLLAQSTLVSQGAEAKVYKGRLYRPSGGANNDEALDDLVLVKYRFHKNYRHPNLDASLTKARVAGEARAIVKCQRSGVNVASILMVDALAGVLALQWIDGSSVRFLLGGGAEGEEVEDVPEDGNDAEDDRVEEEDSLLEYNISKDGLMKNIGAEIGKMHKADVIHGDLTTSNMMLSHPRSGRTDLILIDFGLAYISTLVEDKAVDLYVLERAFSSTHPASEDLFSIVLKSYGETIGKEWKAISRRLDDVRLRGRKRSMVG